MATNTELVQQLYVAYFNRPGDAAGVEFYVNALDKGASIEAIRADFVKAKEYTDTYAGKGNEAIVDQIYVNIFGHHADVPGLKYYAGLLSTIGIDKLPTVIASGAQTTDITAFNSKVTAAAAFTSAIASNAELRIAYANGGVAATNIAKGFLASVTDAASLQTALATVNTTVQGVIPTTTSALAVGLDNFLGTAGNDVINATASNPVNGEDATTLNSADVIDGGAGTDTLNIEVRKNAGDTANLNPSITGTIKNIEIVNINAVDAHAAIAVDASKLGSTLQQVWQIGQAGAVTGLSATATAGFRDITTNVGVAVATGVTTAHVALENYAEGNTIAVTNGASTVSIIGSVKDVNDDGTAVTKLTVAAAKDAQVITLNSAVATELTSVSNAGGKVITTVDASGSAGAITFDASAATAITTIKGGSGDDTLTIATVTAAAAAGAAAIDASISSGAGDDTIEVKTTVSGATTVDAGEGDDTVTITTRSTGVLTVNLGAGDDKFTMAVGQSVGAKDVIDAGEGNDTLLLSLVGAANVGAFSNFDAFDAVGLNKTLDVDILSAKNNVTEFVSSGVVTNATVLTNIGDGVGFRATGDMGATASAAITLTQKTGGALTITVDNDETAAADTAAETTHANVIASNATALKAVFDTSFKANITGEAAGAAGSLDNHAYLNLTGSAAAATTLAVESGGDNVTNVLAYTDTNNKLSKITVTGASALELSATSTSLTTVDASAATGGLTFALANLKDGGSVSLGSGVDAITITSGTNAAGLESIVGFEKADAAAFGTDATAKAAAIADADTLVAAGSSVANAKDVAGGSVSAKGVLTFTGAGPATLADAQAIANLAADGAGEALVFQYLNDSYVFVQDTAVLAADTLVKLTGLTGVTQIGLSTTADHLFLV